MQIPMYWRGQATRYRLQGVRYQNGEVSLQARKYPPSHEARMSDQDLKNPVNEQTADELLLLVVSTSAA